MTLKIDTVYKNKKNIRSKNGQINHDLSNQKEPQPMLNFLHEKKNTFFLRLYHYILLKTSVW